MVNTKSYVGYFPELKHLDKAKQEDILERARYEAFTTLSLNGQSALYLIVSLLIALTIPVLAFFFFNNAIIANAIGILLAVFLCLFLQRFFYGRLLRKGVEVVMSQQSQE